MLESLELTSREPVLDGQPFGDGGAYETLRGRATFAVDPASPLNEPIVDLEYAERDADARVRCTLDGRLLRPVEPAAADRTSRHKVLNLCSSNP